MVQWAHQVYQSYGTDQGCALYHNPGTDPRERVYYVFSTSSHHVPGPNLISQDCEVSLSTHFTELYDCQLFQHLLKWSSKRVYYIVILHHNLVHG